MTEVLYVPMGPDVPASCAVRRDGRRPRVSSLDELFDAARTDVESGWLPSCQLAVARDGELLAFETFGDASRRHR